MKKYFVINFKSCFFSEPIFIISFICRQHSCSWQSYIFIHKHMLQEFISSILSLRTKTWSSQINIICGIMWPEALFTSKRFNYSAATDVCHAIDWLKMCPHHVSDYLRWHCKSLSVFSSNYKSAPHAKSFACTHFNITKGIWQAVWGHSIVWGE